MAGALPQMGAAQLIQYNAAARQACVNQGLRVIQNVYSHSFDPTATQTVNIQPRYVGLILAFIVRVRGTIANATGGVATRTQFGTMNLLRQVVLTDLNNQQRIQTTGWHLGMNNSARQGFVFGGAYAPNVPSNFGNNWNVQTGPATIADSASSAVSEYFLVPCAYSWTDLRGAIYAGVVNATMQLQLTVPTNAQLGVATAVNKTLAVYSSGTAGVTWSGNGTLDVWQVYLDQLPRRADDPSFPMIPPLDLNNIYELKNTSVTGIAAAQDFPVPYPNYRQFLSTTVVYDNGTALNAGSDVNYWAIQAANFTNILKYDADTAALFARQTYMADPPIGVYYFDHRSAPINTANYGNMELVLNASTVNANAQLLVGYEDFAQVNQLVGAASIPGG